MGSGAFVLIPQPGIFSNVLSYFSQEPSLLSVVIYKYRGKRGQEPLFLIYPHTQKTVFGGSLFEQVIGLR